MPLTDDCTAVFFSARYLPSSGEGQVQMQTRIIISAVAMLAGFSAANAGDLEVVGVQPTHHLNIRESGSMSAKVIAGALNGAILKNLGCADGADGRWCNVETKGGVNGFAFAKYLKGDTAMAAAAPVEAMKKPPAFALGTLKCERNNGSPVVDCSYGVLRIGPGARLQITWPDAAKRMFGVFKGTVTSLNGPVVAVVAADGSYDIKLTPTGAPTEHYAVPAEVVSGAK
jgi:Bacterial SH3 domain